MSEDPTKLEMKGILRKNLPDTFLNNELIEEYLEAIGEVFQDIRDDINYKAFETDYALSRPNDVDKLAQNFGLRLNPKLRQEITRRFIRDAGEIYSRLGTRGTLDWALKTLGFDNFDIDEVWVPNPDLIRKGYFRQLNDPDDPIRYDVGRRSYTDFVVGREYVTSTGTYFEGFVYNDFEKDSPIDQIPIYGETYSNYTELDLKNMVSKTPYLLARLYDPPDYDAVISDVDPVTGDPVFVSIEEKVRIINQTIGYLIQELQRTATTKIILVTDLFIFDTTIGVPSETLNFVFNEPEESMTDEVAQLDTTYVEDGRVTLQAYNGWIQVGDNRPIGEESPYAATGAYMNVPRVGRNETYDRDILDDTRRVSTTNAVVTPPLGYKHYIFLDIGADVTFTAPSDSDVSITAKRNYHLSADEDAIGTTLAGQAFSQTINDYHVLVIEFLSASEETVNININYV